jgi:hypothetical protein
MLVALVLGCMRISPRLPDVENVAGGISLRKIIDCSPGNNRGMEMERPKHPVNCFINLLQGTAWAVNSYFMRTVRNFAFAVQSNIKCYFFHILR